MLDFYPQILAAHIGAVVLSGGLFALRGACVIGGLRWAMSAPLRYASYAIDAVLLTAALMLLTLLPAGLFANRWLATKIGLLVLYMVLGSLALKRARTPWVRVACYGAALVVFAQIVGIALAHQPLGWFATGAAR